MEKHRLETQKEKKKAISVEFICDSESVLLLSTVLFCFFQTQGAMFFNVLLYINLICQIISHQYLATFQSNPNPKSGDSHIMRHMTQNFGAHVLHL